MAKNNLFTATETLQQAYQEVVDVEGISDSTAHFLSDIFAFGKPTISEILLDYYEPKKELFPSKQAKGKLPDIQKQKDKELVERLLQKLYDQQMKNDGFTSREEYEQYRAKKFGDKFSKILTPEEAENFNSQNNLEPNKEDKK